MDYIFDLDATLYQDNGEVENDCERLIQKFFAERLNFTDAQSREMREKILHRFYYEAQAMEPMFGISEKEFMDYICATGVSHLSPNPELDRLLAALPGRRFIFTDSTVGHVRDTLRQIKVNERRFERIFDAECSGFCFKFQKAAFEAFFKATETDPHNSILFEDSLRNLKMAKSFGMITILISPSAMQKEKFVDLQFPDINKALAYFIKQKTAHFLKK